MTTPPNIYWPGHPAVLEYMPDEAQHRRVIAQRLNKVLAGDTNAVQSVTLAAGGTTTTIQDPRLSIASALLPCPMTAHAAAEIASGNLYFVPTKGQCVIHHTNNAQTDRTFNMLMVG